MITMPNADSHQSRVLQEDNTDLAYECKLRRLEPRPTTTSHRVLPVPLAVARKFPGYTAESARRS